MFQSDDDITFDAEFLSDAFDLASSTTSVECSKRHSEDTEPQLAKKLCPSSQNTLDILSLLKSKAQNPVEHRFARPVLPNKRRRVVQRKFPGPAGILPAQRDVNIDLNNLHSSDSARNDERCDSDELLCSQQSEDVFTRPPWRRMLQDLGSIPGDVPAAVGLPERYTIAWAKARAARRQLDGGRTPFLAAVVQQIDCSTRNPMAVLKDQTGEIQATLIHELWAEYGEQLHTGAVILLRQVGVLSTAKQHYLTVTLNNLFAIYSDASTSGSAPASNSPTAPVVTQVNHMTSRDFITTLADIRRADKMADSAGLFSDALDDSRTARRDTQLRNDDVDTRLGLFVNAECSKNSATRSNTQVMSASELFPTAEVSFKQARSDNEPRRDTQARSTTHNAPENTPGLLSSAEYTSNPINIAKSTANSHVESIISDTPTFLRPDFDITTEKTSTVSEESEILSQILDGLDAESIFNDF